MKIRKSCSTQGEEQDGVFLGDFEREMEKIASMVDQQEVETLFSTTDSYYEPLKEAIETFADPRVPEGWGDARSRDLVDLVSGLLLTLPKQKWPETAHVPTERDIAA